MMGSGSGKGGSGKGGSGSVEYDDHYHYPVYKGYHHYKTHATAHKKYKTEATKPVYTKGKGYYIVHDDHYPAPDDSGSDTSSTSKAMMMSRK